MNRDNRFTIVEALALGVGIGVTIYLMLRSAEWSIDGGALLFVAWAISPFIIFHLAGRLIRRLIKAPHLPLISAIIAVLMLAFTLVTYVGSMNSDSSTEALIYVFVPIYLYIGSLFLLTLGTVIAWVTGRSRVS